MNVWLTYFQFSSVRNTHEWDGLHTQAPTRVLESTHTNTHKHARTRTKKHTDSAARQSRAHGTVERRGRGASGVALAAPSFLRETPPPNLKLRLRVGSFFPPHFSARAAPAHTQKTFFLYLPESFNFISSHMGTANQFTQTSFPASPPPSTVHSQ